MIDVIRDVFISRLDNLDWIKEDVETVRQIKEKTKSLSKQIGYPDMILDNAKLESHYETLDVRPDELFLNLVWRLLYFLVYHNAKIKF